MFARISDSGYCYNNFIYAYEGIPKNLRFDCLEDYFPGCTSSYVFCDEYWSYYCEFVDSSTEGEGWYCQDLYGTCNVPTGNPTQSPTNYPTKIPSIEPTDSPYIIVPTGIPSKAPTSDIIPPSTFPTLPSESPSSIPSKEPSESPTGAPTVKPSQYPSRPPTAKPTKPPSFVITVVCCLL